MGDRPGLRQPLAHPNGLLRRTSKRWLLGRVAAPVADLLVGGQEVVVTTFMSQGLHEELVGGRLIKRGSGSSWRRICSARAAANVALSTGFIGLSFLAPSSQLVALRVQAPLERPIGGPSSVGVAFFPAANELGYPWPFSEDDSWSRYRL